MMNSVSNRRHGRMLPYFQPVSSEGAKESLHDKQTEEKERKSKNADMRYDQYSFMGKFNSQFSICRNVTPDRSQERRSTKEQKDHKTADGPSRTVGFQVVSYRTPSPSPNKCIQVAPGQYHRLRGADETWRAIQTDHFSPCTCLLCPTQTLFCISDALFVLCPACNVASPLEGADDRKEDVRQGVGLGFTMQELAAWQQQLRHD